MIFHSPWATPLQVMFVNRNQSEPYVQVILALDQRACWCFCLALLGLAVPWCPAMEGTQDVQLTWACQLQLRHQQMWQEQQILAKSSGAASPWTARGGFTSQHSELQCSEQQRAPGSLVTCTRIAEDLSTTPEGWCSYHQLSHTSMQSLASLACRPSDPRRSSTGWSGDGDWVLVWFIVLLHAVIYLLCMYNIQI